MTSELVRPRDAGRDAWRQAAVCALLLLAIGLVFGRVVFHGFLRLDDPSYVLRNPAVAEGLTARGIGWAFAQRHADNWHPLTWLSHMLDVELFGLGAAGHHLTSVLLHAATAALLFLALQRMTGSVWRSAFAAALFALHPLRVESVAWVAERKDVLSGAFFALALGAHAWRARRPSSGLRSFAVALACALGLLSKPMLVTLPAVLLLLDYWPLGRLRRATLGALAREKLPLLALSAGSCAMTLWAQQEAVVPATVLPLAARLANATVSYAAYAGKFLWPVDLAVFYPHPGVLLPAKKVLVAAGGLLAVTAAALAVRRRHPWLLVGWLWHLGMLVPVSGLVQVGMHGMADRYTYLPQIGLGVAVAWGGAAACRPGRCRRRAAAAAGIAILLAAAAAWRQAGHWRDSETLLAHALASTGPTGVVHNLLGNELADQRRLDGAIAQYRLALATDPGYAPARGNLGLALAEDGRLDEAIVQLRLALEAEPENALARHHLGNALAARGQSGEAIEELRLALALAERGERQALAERVRESLSRLEAVAPPRR